MFSQSSGESLSFVDETLVFNLHFLIGANVTCIILKAFSGIPLFGLAGLVSTVSRVSVH